MTDKIVDDFAEEVEAKVEAKVKTPFTDKKKVEVVNKKRSTEWVFIGNILRDGKLYTGNSVCPKGELNKMKELGFVKEV